MSSNYKYVTVRTDYGRENSKTTFYRSVENFILPWKAAVKNLLLCSGVVCNDSYHEIRL